MRPKAQAQLAGSRLRQHQDRQRLVGAIHLAPLPKRDGGVLVVGPLDEADGGMERQQPMEVGGRAAQVGLQAEAHVGVLGLEPLVHGDRCFGVGAALHVDPERLAAACRVLAEGCAVGEGGVRVEVQPQLGELHADLAVQAA